MSKTGTHAGDLRELVRRVLVGLAENSTKPGLASEDAQLVAIRIG